MVDGNRRSYITEPCFVLIRESVLALERAPSQESTDCVPFGMELDGPPPRGSSVSLEPRGDVRRRRPSPSPTTPIMLVQKSMDTILAPLSRLSS